jgi:hypothetical protein
MKIGHIPHKTNTPHSLLYHNGCKEWDDCFTCPLPDCTWHQDSTRNNATTKEKSKQ